MNFKCIICIILCNIYSKQVYDFHKRKIPQNDTSAYYHSDYPDRVQEMSVLIALASSAFSDAGTQMNRFPRAFVAHIRNMI